MDNGKFDAEEARRRHAQKLAGRRAAVEAEEARRRAAAEVERERLAELEAEAEREKSARKAEVARLHALIEKHGQRCDQIRSDLREAVARFKAAVLTDNNSEISKASKKIRSLADELVDTGRAAQTAEDEWGRITGLGRQRRWPDQASVDAELADMFSECRVVSV